GRWTVDAANGSRADGGREGLPGRTSAAGPVRAGLCDSRSGTRGGRSRGADLGRLAASSALSRRAGGIDSALNFATALPSPQRQQGRVILPLLALRARGDSVNP